jgi:signal peptidase I
MNSWVKIGKYGAYLFFLSISFLYIRFFLFQIYYVEGNSMLPNLKNGDMVLVYKYNFPNIFSRGQVYEFGKVDVRRLDILLFETDEGEMLLKRLIGIPGDFYAFRNGSIFIDNKPLTETYTLSGQTSPPVSSFHKGKSSYYSLQMEGRIPPGYYLLLGDNRVSSFDSRNLGLVPEEAIRGKVVYIF